MTHYTLEKSRQVYKVGAPGPLVSHPTSSSFFELSFYTFNPYKISQTPVTIVKLKMLSSSDPSYSLLPHLPPQPLQFLHPLSEMALLLPAISVGFLIQLVIGASVTECDANYSHRVFQKKKNAPAVLQLLSFVKINSIFLSFILHLYNNPSSN